MKSTHSLGSALAVLGLLANGLIGIVASVAYADQAVANDAASIETLPSDRGGQELVGRPMPELDFDRMVRPAANALDDDDAVITLYRWWTNGCPFCETSLPAIEAWRDKYESRGLRTITIYHPKPPRDVSDAFIQRAARQFGYEGPIALDQDWSALRQARTGWNSPRATSVSFLVDHEGVIRFVHPGLDYFPSDDPQHERQNGDHELLERAIEALLVELPDAETGSGTEPRSHE